MGSVVSGLCACFSACSCCSSALSCLNCGSSSTRARSAYFSMFIVCAFMAWILKEYGHDMLKHVGDMENCKDDTCTGRGIVLRISCGMVLVSSVLSLLLFGVTNSSDPRAPIQNDFFFVKWLVLALTVGAMFYFPNENTIQFGYAAAVGAGLFLLIGVLLVLEFAYAWNDSWVENLDNGDGQKWAVMIVTCAGALYGLSITIWALLLSHFGGSGCDHTNAFVGVTIAVSIAVTLLTLPDKIKQGAILPCSVVVLYCSWLCASAVVSIPVDESNQCVARHSRMSDTTESLMRAVGVIFTIFCVAYATIRAASSGQDLTGATVKPSSSLVRGEGNKDEEVAEKAEDDEVDTVQYDYSFFHVIYALGAMYLAMVLISWQVQFSESNGKELGSMSKWTDVWIKIATQWCTFGLYVWTLIAPLVCTWRDFS